ncbi:hypothetical protein DR94_3664 [Proteus mirabilis]|nr:hypothetical protein DR94_3664 [Proteus mirabilis]
MSSIVAGTSVISPETEASALILSPLSFTDVVSTLILTVGSTSVLDVAVAGALSLPLGSLAIAVTSLLSFTLSDGIAVLLP